MSILQQLDTKLFYALHDLSHRSQIADQTLIFLDRMGPSLFGIVLIWYLFSHRRLFWQGLAIVILSRGILTELIRWVYHRSRPFSVLPDVLVLVPQDPGEASFPSGHAAFYFAVAFAIFSFNKRLGSILLVVAAFLSFARIFLGVHYPSDILGGIAVAGISWYVVYKFAQSRISLTQNHL